MTSQPNDQGINATLATESCHDRSLNPVPPLPKSEGYGSTLRELHVNALETFPNPKPQRDYHIHMEIPEFTCLCPKTGQPDFATLILDYIADENCVELKSLKLYMGSFRNEGHFHEDVTNRILDDLIAAVSPRFMRLTARFYVRGGIFTNVVAEYQKVGWQPAPFIELSAFTGQSNTRG
jgi:7-cyano-7-deazaguanine reductase